MKESERQSLLREMAEAEEELRDGELALAMQEQNEIDEDLEQMQARRDHEFLAQQDDYLDERGWRRERVVMLRDMHGVVFTTCGKAYVANGATRIHLACFAPGRLTDEAVVARVRRYLPLA